MPTVSVILATYRRPEALGHVLEDLARQEGDAAEVVVVDQNEPLTPEMIFAPMRGSAHTLRVVPHAPGVVAARNAGARVAKGEVLVFLDDDVRIHDAQFLAKHAGNYLDPALHGVCGRELSPPDFFAPAGSASTFSDAFEEAVFFQRWTSERREVHHLATCNCSLRRETFLQLGGLDEAFGGNAYGDDYDLALRMRKAGLKVVFDPGPSVNHLRAPMGGLRLEDPRIKWSETDKYVSLWLFYFRQVPPKWRRWYLHRSVLRKSLLLKRNVIRPWRWFAVAGGLARAYFIARRMPRP